MASAQCEAAGAPVSATYSPAGETVTLPSTGLQIYRTGPSHSHKVVIFAGDIFGISLQTKRSADAVSAKADALVVQPDFFRGHAWTKEKPLGTDEFKAWWAERCTYEKFWDCVEKEVIPWLHTFLHGKLHLAVMGTCWGGLMAVTASKEPVLKGCVSIHGARLTPDLVKDGLCKSPLLLLPAEDDPDAQPLIDALSSDLKSRSRAHRVHGQKHGFFAARGDLSDKVQSEARAKTEDDIAKFLHEIF
jgi:dienelactone hydrolase